MQQSLAQDAERGPLSGIRVVEMTEGLGEAAGRLLADLGADVILVEPPGGARARTAAPVHEGTSLHFATRNANKRSVTLDPANADERQRLLELVSGADIWLHACDHAALARWGLDPEAVEARSPALVTVALSPFGASGPYRGWRATDRVYLALSGALSRFGLPGRVPLPPPGRLATEAAAYQAAWTALLAYRNRLETGVGDRIDFSVHEAVIQVIDPGYGIGGSATGGRRAADLPRDRPDASALYPIFRCADGFVRICVLSPRQWRGLRAWLGEPDDLADAKYESLGERFKAAGTIYPRVQELFACRTRAELVEAGQRHGVPVAALLEPGEVLTADHFLARGALSDTEVAPGVLGRVPTGFLELDGRRAGWRHRAPEAGEDTRQVLADLPAASPAATGTGGERRHPLQGLRVLDLGVIVAGAELGRLLADHGADVIKVENRAYPDGSRQTLTGEPISASFAWGHRNKRSLGLNLRTERGVELFKQLVAEADVVLSNFKPGTMESLGLGYEELRKVNERIVVADSSALGSSGPWSRRMGYGPLVRASTAVTGLWRYPREDGGFGDASTIFPDHVVGRVGACAVLAQLIRRRRTGEGGTVSISQAEIGLAVLAEFLLQESLAPGSLSTAGDADRTDAPQGVYPCAGDDEWCAVDVHGDDEWQALCAAVERPDLAADARLSHAAGRLAHRQLIDRALTDWTSANPPHAVMGRLQSSGVAAGAMLRVSQLPDDPHLRARGFFAPMRHPDIPDELVAEARPAHSLRLAEPSQNPAPRQAQHTRELCREVLDLSDAQIDLLVAEEVLEEERPLP
ncbi:CaiB/BaiF CoA transferase family protein [Streptomyces cellostaticus]|uniref:CaiB/BaiF CoA transferase family protein n=1 Tax=Streptomyces cellostaticus TaxID=67285 RepID=UPI0020265206|nr:CoA transferase [Streptomyces cellostaticus]